MSDILAKDLAAWLAERAELSFGSVVFYAQTPEDVPLGTAVREYGGPARGYSPTAACGFQVLTRGADEAAVRSQAQKLYDAVYPPPHRLPARMVDLSADWRALSIDAVQPPQDIGISEGGKRQIVFNVQVKAVRLAPAEGA